MKLKTMATVTVLLIALVPALNLGASNAADSGSASTQAAEAVLSTLFGALPAFLLLCGAFVVVGLLSTFSGGNGGR